MQVRIRGVPLRFSSATLAIACALASWACSLSSDRGRGVQLALGCRQFDLGPDVEVFGGANRRLGVRPPRAAAAASFASAAFRVASSASVGTGGGQRGGAGLR